MAKEKETNFVPGDTATVAGSPESTVISPEVPETIKKMKSKKKKTAISDMFNNVGKIRIKPYLDEHLIKLLEDGIKNVAIVTPSFTSDCLETIHEIGVEYRHQYLSAGGDSFHLIPNLNDQPSWFRAVYNMSKDQLN